jgi:hypothetical protein
MEIGGPRLEGIGYGSGARGSKSTTPSQQMDKKKEGISNSGVGSVARKRLGF